MTVRKIQERQAMGNDRIDQLEAEILNLKGKLEENTHFLRLLREENKEMQASFLTDIENVSKGVTGKIVPLETRLGKVEENILTTEGKIALAENRITATENIIDGIKQQQAKEAAKKANDAAARAMEAETAAERARDAKRQTAIDEQKLLVPDKFKHAVADSGQDNKETGSDQQLYDAALLLFQGNKLKEAAEKFSSYLEKYPNGSMAANARFWYGDSLYNLGKYEEAIFQYQEVVVDFPQHDKTQSALLKQGMAFEKLQDVATAKLIFQKIKKEYPNSDQAKTADKRLQALK